MRVAGFGMRAAVTLDTLAALLAQVDKVDALATLNDKADHPAFLALAETFNLPIRPIPRAQLAGLATPTRSCRIEQGFGTGSVAEACALAASGPGARLVQTRVSAENGTATLAVAESP